MRLAVQDWLGVIAVAMTSSYAAWNVRSCRLLPLCSTTSAACITLTRAVLPSDATPCLEVAEAVAAAACVAVVYAREERDT
jgi:hypothetical protein